MRLTRVHCGAPLTVGGELALPQTAASHVARVLRMRAGDALVVFDGRGVDFRAEIVAIAGAAVRVRLLEPLVVRPESPLAITLVQAISRGERMDWTLQKATELGAGAIAPVMAARSVVRLDARQAEAKLRHWQAVVIAACEQAGRSRLPEMRSPESLREHFARASGPESRLVLDPDADIELAAMPSPGDSVQLLVGPEGGFDADELAAARAAGYRTARLGPRVLRTETAGIVAMAILQSRWGDLAG